MDADLVIASKRDERRYADEPLPDHVADAILDSGRLAGSARNRQPWIFLVAESPEVRQGIADSVYVPTAVEQAALVVALVVTPGGGVVDFDAGRAAQNMMLGAWDQGVVSCPHGIANPERLREVLRLADEERAVVALTFGYPGLPRRPERRTAGEWSRRARREPLGRLVRRL
ncbi:MAG: nitroreductase family protein [Miltoncostaeaceae bacterium]